MANPYTAFPTVGQFPLRVNLDVGDIDLNPTDYPIAVASAGYVGGPYSVAAAGYLQEYDDTVTSWRWDFGDGESSTLLKPGAHKYRLPGLYTMILALRDAAGETEYPTEIKVLDETLVNLGISDNDSRCSINHGASQEQGFGWSEDIGRDLVWLDTNASHLEYLDENGDLVLMGFDSITGLPYCMNPRDSYEGSNVFETFLDKVDPLISGTGVDIPAEGVLQEMTGESEAFDEQLSDINFFVSPMERGGSYLSTFKMGMRLYKDYDVDYDAEAQDVPLDRELYFSGYGKEANAINVGWYTTASKFRFRKAEIFLTVYDKARYVGAAQQTESASQASLDDLVSWISRSAPLDLDRCTGRSLSFVYNSTKGPDNEVGSAMQVTTGGDVITLPVGFYALLYWATDEIQNILPVTTFNSIDIDGTTWYLQYLNIEIAVPQLITIPPKTLFDFRIVNGSIDTSMLSYYFNDVTVNGGKNFLPRW